MIAVDTNILVYAHRPDFAEQHDAALLAMSTLSNGRRPWAIPWPCVHEFIGNVTNGRIYKSPTALPMALQAISVWLRSDHLQLLYESPDHFMTLSELCIDGDVAGSQVHDARIAAICVDHGVSQLWTADRDFLRYVSRLPVRNPLKQ
ncbi:MAG: PIN domain-containing protein [Rhodanobacter sp.]|nr:MAG: PIN domain-containing protein [Rhodanobacter sp.]TAM01392.1 MAG: PIN domain-containing protein [Rhodanobacter sp.]TAM38365.1 MAG: PIN domain-containing protein [Rhodanobacter sp.]TAN25948.1 MAG: PIN domain-containing protein [Rhodanobacter sp.]